MTMPSMLIEASGLRGGYRGNDVLKGVSLAVEPGKICGMVGPNGAGKTTFLKAIYGLLPLREGRIILDGRDITTLPVRDRLALGLGYVPQEGNVFPNLSVAENLELAGTRLRNRDPGLKLRDRIDYVFSLFPVLAERRRQPAGLMSGGEQRMVAIGIGLIANPRVLMLDEPTTGLAPIFVHSLMKTIHSLSERENVAAIVVEQNIASLITIADSLIVLKEGRVLPQSISPSQLTNRKIWEYL
jgi:branched-chain amino acid transport system ATP-binding protein